MKRIRSRGVNEIKVKLLPEKAKRDYLLRLVSSIIVLLFIIINILVVYIPRTNLNIVLNDLRSDNASRNLDVLYLENKYNFFYEDIYNKNDGTIKDIINSKLDFNQIMLMFSDTSTFKDLHDNLTVSESIKPENNVRIKPIHSFIESIEYNEADLSFTIAIQFDNVDDLASYQYQLIRIKYVSNVVVGNYTVIPLEDSRSRVKTTFKISLDTENIHCPKVGGLIE
ncbi:hypothetical protein KHQ81_05665 [Mycoplasmatota bacterium]|nr:hypothetical protein KHQ81_05665 [Mycoplasmatota bacterium]